VFLRGILVRFGGHGGGKKGIVLFISISTLYSFRHFKLLDHGLQLVLFTSFLATLPLPFPHLSHRLVDFD
jgi:hypothetical protein